MTSPSRTFRRIAAALMLSTSLTVAAIAIAPKAEAAADPIGTFLTSTYNYCDATLISKSWKIDIDAAKAVIGDKIQNGLESALEASLAAAREEGAACEWADVPHTYEDAERLAAAWGLQDAGEAKDKIAYLYTQGRSAEVLSALSEAGAAPMTPEDQEAWEAFQASDYTYCDAKLVGAAWSMQIDQAKAAIGYKVLNGFADQLPEIFAEGRQTTSCDFTDTLLTYEDAEKLAGIWGVDVGRAKDKAAAYYTNGQSAVVLGALGQSASNPANPKPIVTMPGATPKNEN
ncbi:MAG: hypothetical protein QM698_00910 [Micropepsaceae bacterium]